MGGGISVCALACRMLVVFYSIIVSGGAMPRKIRELRADLSRAGFTRLPGKGSHTKWEHPLVPGTVVLSGQDGADAQPYQEKAVREALQALAKARKKP